MTEVAAAGASQDPYDSPLETLNPAAPDLFRNDTLWPYFERLRREDPVHYTLDNQRGPFWSITKYNDILAIDADHSRFSSAGGITLGGKLGDTGPLPMSIAMDPPKHDVQRKAVSPALSPASLERLEPLIRERASAVLDGLPIGEPFDWVDRVSVELTAMTLATLFGIPQEDRRRLTRWSDVVTAKPGHGVVDTKAEKRAELMVFADYFTRVWNERVNAEPTGDLISMLAHSPATRGMGLDEYFGNVILQQSDGQSLGAEHSSGGVRQAARRSRPGPVDGQRGDPLADTAGAHEARGAGGRDVRRQDHPQGRAGDHVVRLRQP